MSGSASVSVAQASSPAARTASPAPRSTDTTVPTTSAPASLNPSTAVSTLPAAVDVPDRRCPTSCPVGPVDPPVEGQVPFLLADTTGIQRPASLAHRVPVGLCRRARRRRLPLLTSQYREIIYEFTQVVALRHVD